MEWRRLSSAFLLLPVIVAELALGVAKLVVGSWAPVPLPFSEGYRGYYRPGSQRIPTL